MDSIASRLVVEAGNRFGWERFVWQNGRFVTIDHFRASAPGTTLLENFCLTVFGVVTGVRTQLRKK